MCWIIFVASAIDGTESINLNKNYSRYHMENKKESLHSAVWNDNDGVWVVVEEEPDGMTTAPTILELGQVIGDSKLSFPIQVRYPGNVEVVDQIH
jgi:hypothetical protein